MAFLDPTLLVNSNYIWATDKLDLASNRYGSSVVSIFLYQRALVDKTDCLTRVAHHFRFFGHFCELLTFCTSLRLLLMLILSSCRWMICPLMVIRVGI